MESLVLWHRWRLPNELDDALLRKAQSWTQSLRRHVRRAGGEVIAQAGASLVAVFPAEDLGTVAELCLAQLARLERHEPEAGTTLDLDVSIALSLGPVLHSDHGRFGEPIERARALAHTAGPGALVLDLSAQQPLAGEYLFSESVRSAEGVQGEVLDRAHPRRRDCRAALSHLKPVPNSAAGASQLAALRQLAAGEGRQRIALVGPHGAGASRWMNGLAQELNPPVWLHLSPVAGSMAPLGALAYALKRLQRSPRPQEHWLDPSNERDAAALTALSAIRDGHAVSKKAAAGALRHFLSRVAERSGERAWIDLHPVAQLDPATQRVIAEATREGGPKSLTVLRLLPGQRAPASFGPGGPVGELRLAALTHREAQRIAAHMLGDDADRGIARKAALTGGPTLMGVIEAVRAMVSSGEIVFQNRAFRWRRGPGGSGGVVPMETLLEQRLEQLEAAPRRMLEVLASVPDTTDGRLLDHVATQDGLDDTTQTKALAQLLREGYLTARAAGMDLSPAVGSVVLSAMPTARRAELCRFVANVLKRDPSAKREFGAAQLAYYLAHADRPREAVGLYMETARLAGKLGWVRTAVRLAAAAVQTDPSEQTRQTAAELTRALAKMANSEQDGPPTAPRMSLPPPFNGVQNASGETGERAVRDSGVDVSSGAIQKALRALLAGDAEEVDRALELAVASGSGGGAIDRLRAMSLLGRGDHPGALRLLNEAEGRLEDGTAQGARARLSLAQALVWLEADQVPVALRSALRSLAIARKLGDAHGVSASLRTLATCYRRLGRERDAADLEAAS